MNSQTKIVVIRMKWLIIAVIAAIVLIAGIVLYFNMEKMIPAHHPAMPGRHLPM